VKKIFAAVLLGIAVMFILAGFGRRENSPTAGPVDFQVILSGSYSNATQPRVELVKSERQWDAIWQIAMGREEPLPEKPTVDFGSQYVIAAFMGERSSSGYHIEIDKIEKAGRKLKVHIKNYETPGMLTVMTQPFTLVRVQKGRYELEVIQETVR
jgi:hypothetical protein